MSVKGDGYRQDTTGAQRQRDPQGRGFKDREHPFSSQMFGQALWGEIDLQDPGYQKAKEEVRCNVRKDKK